MRVKRLDASCGGVQLFNLADVSEVTLNQMLRSTYKLHRERTDVEKGEANGGTGPGCIFAGETVVFSDTVQRLPNSTQEPGGSRLVKIINEHDLGRIQSLTTTNPNTRREIRTRIWVYNGNKINRPRG